MISVFLHPKAVDQHLDPRAIPYTNDFYILENLTTKLLSFDENGNYQLELASNVKKINELEYHFKIKRTFFSNGELVELVDVKKTFERIMKYGSSHADLKDLIHSIEIVEDTLRFKLNKFSKSFFYYLSLPDLGILHRSQYEKESLLASDFIKVSSGPFRYEAKNEGLFLIKNEFYKVNTNNYPDKVELLSSFKKDASKALIEGSVHLGKVSVRYYLENKEKFLNHENLRVIGVPSGSLTYLYFNKYSNSFKDIDHRRWLREVINNSLNVPQEFEQIARRTRQYFPPESKAYLEENEVDAEIENFKISERPKDFPAEITIHTYTTAYDVTIEKVVRNLEKISGLKVVVKDDVPPSDYVTMMKKGQFDIFLNIMSTDFRTPVEAINFEFFSENGPLQDNTGDIRKNFDLYQSALSENEEIEHLKKISKTMLKNVNVIPLFHSAIPFIYNTNEVDIGGLNHLFLFNFWKLKRN